MKERGMIFNGEMVRAILDGRKTQTRRIMKVQPEHSELGLRRVVESKNGIDDGKYFWSQSDATGLKSRSKPFACPFGTVGDRIWVREAFRVHSRATDVATWYTKPASEIRGRSKPTECLWRSAINRQLLRSGHHRCTCRAGRAAFCWKSPTCGLSG